MDRLPGPRSQGRRPPRAGPGTPGGNGKTGEAWRPAGAPGSDWQGRRQSRQTHPSSQLQEARARPSRRGHRKRALRGAVDHAANDLPASATRTPPRRRGRRRRRGFRASACAIAAKAARKPGLRAQIAHAWAVSVIAPRLPDWKAGIEGGSRTRASHRRHAQRRRDRNASKACRPGAPRRGWASRMVRRAGYFVGQNSPQVPSFASWSRSACAIAAGAARKLVGRPQMRHACSISGRAPCGA
jgi:hypothetical protein